MTDARRVWNERYSARRDPYGTAPNEFVAAELGDLSPRRVLDLGCGQGRNSVWLAARGHTVTGLDFSDVAIARAEELAELAGVGVDFRAIDIVREWLPEPEFDLVVLSYFQLPPSTRRMAHAKAVRAVKPGGRLFLVAHHADNLEHGVAGPPMAEVLYDESQLAADFGELEILRNEKVLRPVELPDGIRHAHDILLEAVKPRD
jgi:SAM-dependent methyltransferase